MTTIRLCLSFVLLLSSSALSGCGESDCYHFGGDDAVEIVITFERGTALKQIREIVDAIDGTIVDQYPVEYVTVRIPGPDLMCDALAFLEGQESVVVAIPNWGLDLNEE